MNQFEESSGDEKVDKSDSYESESRKEESKGSSSKP